MAIGASVKPAAIQVNTPGQYSLTLSVDLQAGERRSIVTACALAKSQRNAFENLNQVLGQRDPLATNRQAWNEFYEEQVPRFECSDASLNELYAFRWFLLKFSTAGGGLGYFKYPVVMEGRQAYQTYCCYSAPFMAFEMNWAKDPNVGFGHIANMTHAAYSDGRFPWYTSPRSNEVKLDHASKTGLSLLPHTAWHHFQIHGDETQLAALYPAMKRNVEWWLKDRDPNGDGAFDVAHQLETGQDDLFRWGPDKRDMRYDAVDATSYAYLNLRAVESMAKAVGAGDEAKRFAAAALRSKNMLENDLWDSKRNAWFDRHPSSGKLATHYLAITTFYPWFAGAGSKDHLSSFTSHLFNPEEFWLTYPVPALPKNHSDYSPTKFWEGPSWPAATSHVIEGLATAAKTIDRSLLPKAADLLRRATANHLQPRADFYERYNGETGSGLSLFRDYMHSWWIDIYMRHIVGLSIHHDGSVSIDPLPLGLDDFSARNIPFRGRTLEVHWSKRSGLRVVAEQREILRQPGFQPGDAPARVSF
ncbi:MAG: trehalase family glycosidase [Planctomycetota bacterium]